MAGYAPAPLPHLSLVLSTYGLNTETGTFTLSGQNAALRFGVRFAAEHGSFTLAGQDSTYSILGAASMEYPAPLPHLSLVLTGVATDLFLPALHGTFAVSGQDAQLRRGQALQAETGIFTVVGAPAELDLELDCSAGAFTLSGQTAGLNRSRLITAAQGSYTLTGFSSSYRIETTTTRTLPAAPGYFVLSGQAAGSRRTNRLTAEYGSFMLSGQPARLVSVGWSKVAEGAGSWVQIPAGGGTWVNN